MICLHTSGFFCGNAMNSLISSLDYFQGDKKDLQDSLDPVSTLSKHEEQPSSTSSHLYSSSTYTHSTSSKASTLTPSSTSSYSSTTKQEEYTYDRAIQGYRQYAENTAKKLSSTSLSNLSTLADSSISADRRDRSPVKAGLVSGKLNFFAKEIDRSGAADSAFQSTGNVVTLRERSPSKVSISKRKSMFEMSSQSQSTFNLSSNTEVESKVVTVSKSLRDRSADMSASTGNLKNRVASFENLDYDEPPKHKVATPQRDSKFKEKLATFSSIEKEEPSLSSSSSNSKVAPVKDKMFFQKLSTFSSIENSSSSITNLNPKTTHVTNTKPQPPSSSNRSSLKHRIASFEQLDTPDSFTPQQSNRPVTAREMSRSTESLRKVEVNTARSQGARVQTTPFIDVSIDKLCYAVGTENDGLQNKRSTIYENVEACVLDRQIEKSPMFAIFAEVNCLPFCFFC